MSKFITKFGFFHVVKKRRRPIARLFASLREQNIRVKDLFQRVEKSTAIKVWKAVNEQDFRLPHWLIRSPKWRLYTESHRTSQA